MKQVALLIGCVLILTACAVRLSPPTQPSDKPRPTPDPTSPIATAAVTRTRVAAPTLSSSTLAMENTTAHTQLETPPAPAISSPLQGISISELPKIISNPYLAPQIGKDDGHHGVDYAFYDFKDLRSITGLPIQSVFSGKIAGITQELPPYGNAIIIESDLPDNLPELLATNLIPEPQPTGVPSAQLTCPDLPVAPQSLLAQDFSLYVLYGHLADHPPFVNGDAIVAGDRLGNVGNSGMSGNPHLHLEFRVGPRDFPFEAMGHYSSALTQTNFANYCIWRVSGWFIPFDPMLFFNSLNSSAN